MSLSLLLGAESAKIKEVIAYAKTFIGVRYFWPDAQDAADGAIQQGNDDPIAGFDCAGYVSELCRAGGWLPNLEADPGYVDGYRPDRWDTNDFWTLYPRVAKPAPGCLVLYGENDDTGHVSFVISKHHIIEAGGGGHGTTSDLECARDNGFVRIRPITWRASEIMGYVKPFTSSV